MKNWVTTTYQADYDKIANRYKISKLLAELLVKRGLFDWESMDRFLFPEMKDLRNPYEMKDFEKAVNLIEEAISGGKKIKVVGDYDVDGVTSTYILVQGIRMLGGEAGYRIPHRMKDGYGIRDYMAEEAAGEGYDMILTCDNGISAVDAVAKAKELGMTVVITDHHEVPKDGEEEVLPPADAIVDPKQRECSYPFKELCGAGIAYKLMRELFRRAGRTDADKEFLSFAAIATVCDVVPLFDENRILVKNGLEELEKTENTGLRALIDVQEFQKKIGTGELGFRLGPCINAAGRIDDATFGLELFLEQDAETAKKKAEELKLLNEERKNLTEAATKQAVKQLEEDGRLNQPVYVIFLEDCHESIAGIVAGRLKEKYFHPAIVFTKGKKGLKGSGRSIPGYHMQQEISKCKELLIEFGGHAMAAGMTLAPENLEKFSDRLNRNCVLTEEDFTEKIQFDKEVDLGDINKNILSQLSYLEPFGEGNPPILFAKRGLRISSLSLCGKENQTARVKLSEGAATYQAVDFQCELHVGEAVRERYGEETWEKVKSGVIPEISLDILYSPKVNDKFGGIDYRIKDAR